MPGKRPAQRGKRPKPKKQVTFSISFRGKEYSSPNPAPEGLECPICKELLEEPQQTTPCGHMFCKKCLVALVRADDSQGIALVKKGTMYEHPVTCPTCRTSCTGWFEDKNVDRSVKNIEIFCPNGSCEWKGSLCRLEDHKAGRGCEGCQYEPVSCTLGCGEEVIRKNLEEHKQNTCASRPLNCKYCQWLGTCEIMNNHYSECQKYPIPCPNNCDQDEIPVQEVENHLQECPEQVIKCTHSDLGCTEVFKRRLSEDHYENFKDVHNHLLRSRVTLLTQVVVQLLQDKDKPTSSSASSQTSTLSLVSRPWLENTKLFPSMPWIIRFDEFSKKKTRSSVFWTSPPFFTTSTGYKLCLLVYAGGDGEQGRGHVSVFTQLRRGPNDDILSWPFDKTVKVTLLNQLEDRYHHSRLTNFKLANLESTQIKPGKVSTLGLGHPKFIAQDMGATQNCQYLRDDCLFFKIELEQHTAHVHSTIRRKRIYA